MVAAVNAAQTTHVAFLRCGSIGGAEVSIRPMGSHILFVETPHPHFAKGAKVTMGLKRARGHVDVAGTVVEVLRKPSEQLGVGTGYLIELAQPHGLTSTSTAPEGASKPARTRKKAERAAIERGLNGLVLVVDDDRVLGRMIKAWLRKLHRVTMTVATGKEALEIVRSGKYPLDLVIVDSILPDTGGAELIKKILDEGPVPIIATSGILKDHRDEVKVKSSGASVFLPKPLSEADVRQVILRLIGTGDATEARRLMDALDPTEGKRGRPAKTERRRPSRVPGKRKKRRFEFLRKATGLQQEPAAPAPVAPKAPEPAAPHAVADPPQVAGANSWMKSKAEATNTAPPAQPRAPAVPLPPGGTKTVDVPAGAPPAFPPAPGAEIAAGAPPPPLGAASAAAAGAMAIGAKASVLTSSDAPPELPAPPPIEPVAPPPAPSVARGGTWFEFLKDAGESAASDLEEAEIVEDASPSDMLDALSALMDAGESGGSGEGGEVDASAEPLAPEIADSEFDELLDKTQRDAERFHWAKLVIAYQHSGMTIEGFESSYALPPGHLENWIGTFAGAQSPPLAQVMAAPTLPNVPPPQPMLMHRQPMAAAQPPMVPMPAAAGGDNHFEVVLNDGRRARFPIGTPVEYITALLGQLKGV